MFNINYNNYSSNSYNYYVNSSLDNMNKINLMNSYTDSIDYFIPKFDFITKYLLIDNISKTSLLDTIVILSNNESSLYKFSYFNSLSKNFYNDLIIDISTKTISLEPLLRSEYQDIFTVVSLCAPDLVVMWLDFFEKFGINSSFVFKVTSIFDTYSDNIEIFFNTLEIAYNILNYYTIFLIFILFSSVVINYLKSTYTLFNLAKWNYYLYSISKEFRMQYEFISLIVISFIFYLFIAILSFDDSVEADIELLTFYLFYSFSFIIIYLLYKYSIHYFTFLDSSVKNGRVINSITSQLSKDFLNSLGLMLRFYILLFRINVYDTLDDFFDSYYIFVGDLEEDEYLGELIFSVYNKLFFLIDNENDLSITLEGESEFYNDIFYVYFIIWGKIFYFLAIIVEEIARLALAFYVCYLITFEVHNVNCSYNESKYFDFKKN